MSETKKGFWESVASSMALTITEMGKPAPKEPEIEAEFFLDQALMCLDERRTRHDSQSLAAELALKLRSAEPVLQAEFLAALAVGLGAEKKLLKDALDKLDWHDVDMARLEATVSKALGSKRRRLCKLWLSMDGALEFLVWLREVALERFKTDQAVGPLKDDLDDLFGEIFAQGLLEMRPVTWGSPAKLLEKIMAYDRVHEMNSWSDMKARLEADRRVYALFHSGWDDEPLAFLEVALTKGVAKSAKAIFEQQAPMDINKADTASFYSINSPHAGLKGISLGEDLIRKSVESMRRELPNIKTFCTLSPIPGFARWLEDLSQEVFEGLCGTDLLEKFAKKVSLAGSNPAPFRFAIKQSGWHAGPEGEAAKDVLEKLCAKYLAGVQVDAKHKDAVAKFHLGNGAKVESLRHLADVSEKGLGQSRGMMVNYLYELGDLEKNKLSRVEGNMAASWSIKRLAQG